MLVVGVYSIEMRDCFTKKNFKSMFLEREVLLVFLEKYTYEELSHNNFSGLEME